MLISKKGDSILGKIKYILYVPMKNRPFFREEQLKLKLRTT